MLPTQNATISSPVTAHRVFLLHLESMRLLGEESRCNGQSAKNSETPSGDTRHSRARRLGWTVLLLALLMAASVVCGRAQSTMGGILGGSVMNSATHPENGSRYNCP
jgi:hypothetical protein